MATVPGGIFDPATTPLTVEQGDIINKALTAAGVDESDLDEVRNDLSAVILEGTEGDVTTTAGVVNATTVGPLSTTVAPGTTSIITFSGFDANERVSFTLVGENGAGATLALTDGGPTISDGQAKFLTDAAVKMNADSVTLASIEKAINLLSENGDGTPSDLVVSYLRLGLGEGASDSSEVKVDLSSSAKDVLLAARLLDMKAGSTLVLTGVEKVLVVGAGNVRIDGSEGAMVVGDTTAQNIAGGMGADTLVGGGGNDTLTGGAGDDVFGFAKIGHYTITDFTVGEDMLAFGFEGVDSINDLKPYLSGVSQADGNTTFNFGANASITLVGVSTDVLTADMVKFTIS